MDEEPHNRQLLEVMLAPVGCLPQTVRSGEEAPAVSELDALGAAHPTTPLLRTPEGQDRWT
jgi:hypothetical protein